MSFDDALLGFLLVLFVSNIPVAVILGRAALRKPHIWAVTITALATLALALGMAGYILVLVDGLLGYPVDQVTARAILRLVFVFVGLQPVLFLWAYWTGRFRAGTE